MGEAIQKINATEILENWEVWKERVTKEFSHEILGILEQYFSINKNQDGYYLHIKGSAYTIMKEGGILVDGTLLTGEDATKKIYDMALGNSGSSRGYLEIGDEVMYEKSIPLDDIHGDGTTMMGAIMKNIPNDDMELVTAYVKFLDKKGYGNYIIKSVA